MTVDPYEIIPGLLGLIGSYPKCMRRETARAHKISWDKTLDTHVKKKKEKKKEKKNGVDCCFMYNQFMRNLFSKKKKKKIMRNLVTNFLTRATIL
jgi:hypothetical protein